VRLSVDGVSAYKYLLLLRAGVGSRCERVGEGASKAVSSEENLQLWPWVSS
jgi:hypothetical protein